MEQPIDQGHGAQHGRSRNSHTATPVTGGARRRLLLLGALLAGVAAVGFFGYRCGTYRARLEKSQAAAVSDAAQLEKLERLRLAAEEALALEDLAAAGAAIAELRLTGGVEAAADLQKRYEALADGSEVKKRCAVATLARERARKMERGQGFGERLDALETAWCAAEAARQSGAWGHALSGYDEVLAMCGTLRALEMSRGVARGLRDEAELAKAAAESADAGLDADHLVAAGWKALLSAGEAFEKGEFSAAAKLWQEAADAYTSALPQAEGIRAYRKAKGDFEAALATAAELLDKYGGETWEEAKRQSALGEASANDPTEGARVYTAALEKLLVALEEAQEKEQEEGKEAVVALSSAVKEEKDDARLKELSAALADALKASALADWQTCILLAEQAHVMANGAPPPVPVIVQIGPLILDPKPAQPPDEPEKVPGPTAGKTWTIDDLEMTFKPVASGDFWMGSVEGRAEEKPVHRVRIVKDYWIGKTEVTQAQWRSVMGQNPSTVKGDNLPVETVEWAMCDEFSRKLTARERVARRLPDDYCIRLPTEAEWEFAARGGVNSWDYTYSGGNDLGLVGWFAGNSGMTTHPVGTRMENELHVYDMSGNVSEWCMDDWHWTYEGAPADGSSWGRGSGQARMCRGGNWFDEGSGCRVVQRESRSKASRYLGLRLVLSAINTNMLGAVAIKKSGADATAVRSSKGPAVEKGWNSPAAQMEFVWVPDLEFWVAKYPVTNGEYRKKERKHDSATYQGLTLNDDRQPVVNVNFESAKAYATWLTEKDKTQLDGMRYRVPSETEWQTFAQCGDGREYPWGNSLPPRYRNYSDSESATTPRMSDYFDGFAVTCPVEQSGANEFGLYGVGGNVWECTASDASDTVFGAWRGASWNVSQADYMRCSYRVSDDGKSRGTDSGFRLVLSR